MSNLQNVAMLVNLSIAAWTASVKDEQVSKAVKTQHTAAPKSGWFSKKLLDPVALQELKTIESRVRSYHYRVTLAWGDNGDRVLPGAMFMEYTAQLRALIGEFDAAVEAFVARYPTLITEAKTMLGTMYNEKDYPTAGDIRARFGVKLVYSPVPAANDFRVDVGDDAIKEIRESIQANLNARLVAATRECFDRLYEVVQAVHVRLDDPKAIFRDSLIENVQVLVDVLPSLNIADNTDLKSAVANARANLLEKPEALRKNRTLRANVASAAGTLMKTIEQARQAVV